MVRVQQTDKGTSREVNKLKSEVTSQGVQVDFSFIVVDSLCVVVMPASSAQKYHICRKYLQRKYLDQDAFSIMIYLIEAKTKRLQKPQK